LKNQRRQLLILQRVFAKVEVCRFVITTSQGASSPDIGSHWERLWLTHVGTVAVEDHWSAFLILHHQTRILEVPNQGCFALNAGVGDFAHFLAVEFLPFLVVERLIERDDGLAVDKVNERISNVAFVLKVNRQVEEIVASSEGLVHGRKQHLLVVLVRDVANHQRGSLVISIANSVKIQAELGLVFHTVRPSSLSADFRVVLWRGTFSHWGVALKRRANKS